MSFVVILLTAPMSLTPNVKDKQVRLVYFIILHGYVLNSNFNSNIIVEGSHVGRRYVGHFKTQVNLDEKTFK